MHHLHEKTFHHNCSDCKKLNSIQLEVKKKNFIAKFNYKKKDFQNFPLLLQSFEDYLKQDKIRHFYFYTIHNLKSNEHIEQFRDWHKIIYPESNCFISNLKYTRENTYDENKVLIDKYLNS